MTMGFQHQFGFINTIVAALQAGNTIINKNGVFVYSPTPGPNNLIASVAPFGNGVSTVDNFGNKVLRGVASYALGGSVYFAAQLAGANTLYYLGGATQAANYVQVTGIGNGIISPGGLDIYIALQATSLLLSDPAYISGGKARLAWLGPSKDTTGATDFNNVFNLINTYNLEHIYCMQGTYYNNAPINLNKSFVTVEGMGQQEVVWVPTTTAAQEACFILGPSLASGLSTVYEQVGLKNISINATGNTFSGHGLTCRVENPVLEDIYVTGCTGDLFHFSWDGLSTAPLDSVVAKNLYGNGALTGGLRTDGSTSGAGLYTDQYLTSSEFWACHFNGQFAAGQYGMDVSGGSLKFFACHPYGWTLGGAIFRANARNCQILGGEYESNLGFEITDLSINLRIIGANCYNSLATVPPAALISLQGQHCIVDAVAPYNDAHPVATFLVESGAADYNTICNCDCRRMPTPTTAIQTIGTHSKAYSNAGYNPVGFVAAPAYVAGSPATNTFGVTIDVYALGSTAMAINGVATGIAAGTFPIEPGETITPTGAAGSWKWRGH